VALPSAETADSDHVNPSSDKLMYARNFFLSSAGSTMSKIERKWWFVGLVAGASGFFVRQLLLAAELPMSSYDGYQWLIYGLCVLSVWRLLSFVVWFGLLCISPSIVKPAPN
jgi:hypothetical protein